jgi:hypothetical protein
MNPNETKVRITRNQLNEKPPKSYEDILWQKMLLFVQNKLDSL